MAFSAFYHYDGVKSDITESIYSFAAKRGAFPDFGGLTVKMTYPVRDSAGNVVTLEKGDVLWPHLVYGSINHTPQVGIITEIQRSGDFITVTADSLMAPLMKMRHVIDNAQSSVRNHIMDVLSGYTAPFSLVTDFYFPAYRRANGTETWDLDTTLGFLLHGEEIDAKAFFQYLIEQPANLWLEKPTGVIFPKYTYGGAITLPQLSVGYTGYGCYRQAEMSLSYDNGILKPVEWYDPDESVLNDVTITVRGGSSIRYSDATSIAAYGSRASTLMRGILLEGATGGGTDYGYDAGRSVKAIVGSMKDPHKRCRLTCEMSPLLDLLSAGEVGFIYRIVDELTGADESMTLRSYTFKYPQEIVECEFDNAPLNMANYGLRMENRVTSLEANIVTAHSGFYDLQGGVSPGEYYHLNAAEHGNLTGGTPTFNALTLNNTVNGQLTALADGSLRLLNTHGDFNFGPKNANYSYLLTDRPAFAMNKRLIFYNTNVHDIGDTTYNVRSLYLGTSLLMGNNTVIDASRNITCGNITPHSINTVDLGSLTNYWNELYVNGAFMSSMRSMDTSSLDGVIQVAQNTDKNVWLRFRISGANTISGLLFSNFDSNHWWTRISGSTLLFNYGTSLTYADAVNKLSLSNVGNLSIAGDYYGGRLFLTSSTHSTDMGVINNTSPTADNRVNLSINRTNQTGTMLYLSIYDAKNGSFGGVMLKGLRLTGTANCNLSSLDNGMLNIQTSYGYLKIGPNNTTWCHFYTDLGKYYFNKGMDVVGNLDPYSTGNYDLGTSSKRWRDLYLDGSCSMLQNLTVGGDIVGNGVIGASAMATRTMSASSTVQHENAVARSATTTSSPGSVVKRSKVNYAMTGTFYVKWTLRSATYGTTVYGRLYKNGSALGSVRSTNSDGGVTYTEGPYTNIAAGDEFQIYAYTTAGNVSVWVSGLQICFTPSTLLSLYSSNL